MKDKLKVVKDWALDNKKKVIGSAVAILAFFGIQASPELSAQLNDLFLTLADVFATKEE
jgi:hypothetical protein